MKRSMLLFDSFAWVEYFSGSRKGEKVKEFIENTVRIYTPTICLTEIGAKYLREKKDPSGRIDFIEKRSIIVPLDTEIALRAGRLKAEKRLHTADAIIYASAIEKGCDLVTGDPHFQDLEKVILL